MARVIMIRPAKPGMPNIMRAAAPPMGLMYLAAYANQARNKKDFFTIIDERVNPKDHEHWSAFMDKFEPDCIAISVMSDEAERLFDLTHHFKSSMPKVPIILGGPYVSSMGSKIFSRIDADYLVKGEGEIPFRQLLDTFDKKDYDLLKKIYGLIYKNGNGSIVENELQNELLDVNDLPFPAWELVNLDDYVYVGRMTPIEPVEDPSRYAALFTSRGCPYQCTYCHNIFSKKFRPMRPERIVDEIEYLIDTYDVHDFEIYDDIFNLDYERTMKFCAEIKKRGIITRFSFPNGVRGDLLDKKLIMALRQAGVYHMAFAVESANPRIQELVRKRINLTKIYENIALAAEAGIFTWGFFMLGFPTETRREIWNTLKFAFSSKLHGAFFFAVIPQEGTELADMCAKGSIDPADNYNTDYNYAKNTISEIGPRELFLIQSYASLRFFFGPSRIIRIFNDYPYGIGFLFLKCFRIAAFILFLKPLHILKNKYSKLAQCMQTSLDRLAQLKLF